MRKNEDDVFDSFLKTVAKTLIAFASSVYFGWALSVLWGWFAVAYLGLPAITTLGGISISLIYGALAMITGLKPSIAADLTIKASKQELYLEVIEWAGTFISASVLLLMGAFWHFGMFPLLILFGVS